LELASKNRLLLIICSVGFLLIIIIALLWNQNNVQKSNWQKNTVAVKYGNADISVIATGVIRPSNEVKISPKQTGLLKSLLVKQGDRVKKDQIIALMDDSNLLGQVESARGAYLASLDNFHKMKTGNRPQEIAASKFQQQRAEKAVKQAEQNINRLQTQVEALTAQLKRDEIFAKRQSFLSDSGAVSEQAEIDAATQAQITKSQLHGAEREHEQAQSALAQSIADLNTIKQQHILMKSGFRAEEVAAAEHNSMQTRGQLLHMESLLNDTKIRAPFDGVITQKYTDAGAIVTPTTSAATTSATSSSIVSLAGNLEMVAQVSESNIAKIKIGQPVEITASAYPNKVFHGHVTQIAPAAIVTQNVTTFEVHSDLTDDNEHELLSGLNVNAKFITGQVENSIRIPTVSVISRKGQNGVFVPNEKGEPIFRAVKVGPTSGQEIIILEGLNAKDKVFLGLSKEQLEKEGYIDQRLQSRNSNGILPTNRGMTRGFGR
jgi:HlyD family secretion protein